MGLLDFRVSRSWNALQRAASADASKLIPRILRSDQGVDDCLGRGVGDTLSASLGQVMAIRFQMCRIDGRTVDGVIPSINQDITVLSDFTNHHVQSLDVVVPHEVLKIIPHRRSRRDDQIRFH